MKIEHILALLFLAIIFLSTSPTTEYLVIGDAWYHYRIAKLTMEVGYRPGFDTLSNSGEKIAYPPFFHYFLATLSRISGLDVFFISQIYPRFMALFIILIVFLIAREFFNEKISLLAALFQAMIPTFMLQTSYGWGDHDALSLLLLYSSCFLFIKIIKGKKDGGSVYAFLGGILFGTFALTWIGFPVFLVLVWGFIVILSLLDSILKMINKDLLYKISLFIFVGLVLASVWYSNGEILPLFEASILVLIFATFSYLLGNFKLAPFLLLAIFVISLFGLSSFKSSLVETGLAYIGLKEKSPLLEYVAELKKPNLKILENSYGVTILIPILGILVFTYRKIRGIKIEDMFFIMWFISYLVPATSATRFIIYFSIFVSSLSAFLVLEFSNFIGKFINKDLFLPIAAVILILTFINTTQLSSTMYNFPPVWITNDRYEAFVWLKNSSNSSDVIMNWWDYSPWINAIAERKTVVNNQPPGRFEDHAIFFGTDNWSKAQEILIKYNVSYVTVDIDTLPKVYIFEMILNESIPFYVGETDSTSRSLLYANLDAGLATFLDVSSGIAWNDYGYKGKVYYREIGYFDSSENKIEYISIDTKDLSSTDDFLVAYSNLFVRIPKETKNRVFFQLMYLNSNISYLKLIYENQHLRIYKVII